jgi:hypothetical protein
LIYGHLRPAQLRLRPYYRDRVLQARSGVGSPDAGQTDAVRTKPRRLRREPLRVDIDLNIAGEI